MFIIGFPYNKLQRWNKLTEEHVSSFLYHFLIATSFIGILAVDISLCKLSECESALRNLSASSELEKNGFLNLKGWPLDCSEFPLWEASYNTACESS